MPGNNRVSLGKKLNNLIIGIITPLIIIIVVLIGVLLWNVARYNEILDNVTKSSEFNQNFKNDVDLRMFYYVIDCAYADGLPKQEVEAARDLALDLIDSTSDATSKDAIQSVYDLTLTLDERMEQIAQTQNYDEKVDQLDNNIYILTDLIQQYMYDYLYYESVHLSETQAIMSAQVRFLIIMLILAVGVVGIFLTYYGRTIAIEIAGPIKNLNDRVDQIRNGDLTVKSPIDADEEEIYNLSCEFEGMVHQINELIADNKQAERNKRHAELALLQAQINPHFLYNTLDTIIWLIESDQKQESIDMVNSLSDFFRFSLSRGKDAITLREEKRHVLSYLQIQKTRYADRMDYEIDIPEELDEYIIPKLTLQPLVENSIYHGIKMQREKGSIIIKGRDFVDRVSITVSDTGAGMTKERLDELNQTLSGGQKLGFGLRTVDERIKLFFGDEYGIKISSQEGKGTDITIIIPKQISEVEG